MDDREPGTRGTTSTHRWTRRPRGVTTLGMGIVALLAVSGFAAACGGHGGSGGGGSGLTTSCSARGPVDALDVPLAVPGTPASAGSTLSAAYEVEILNYSGADSGSMIHVPSFYVKVPLNATSKFSLYFAPTNVTVTSSGWSSPVEKTGTLAASTNFDAGSGTSATGSTVSIAVMAKDRVGNLSVAFRWGWTLNVSGTVSSLWSVPSATATSPALPSILTPAPFVGLGETTNTTAAPAGSVFEAAINGAVGRTSFGVSVEYPNGTEVVCKEQSNPQPSACFVVSVPLTTVNSTPLAPGAYIVHIHDAYGAIVHTISVTVVNATQSGHGWGSHSGSGAPVTCSCQGSGGSGHGGHHGGHGGHHGHGRCSTRGAPGRSLDGARRA